MSIVPFILVMTCDLIWFEWKRFFYYWFTWFLSSRYCQNGKKMFLWTLLILSSKVHFTINRWGVPFYGDDRGWRTIRTSLQCYILFNFSYHHYNAVFLHQNHVFKTKQLPSDFLYFKRVTTQTPFNNITTNMSNTMHYQPYLALVKAKVTKKVDSGCFIFIFKIRTHAQMAEAVRYLDL